MAMEHTCPYRAFTAWSAFDVGQHVRNVYDVLGFVPSPSCDPTRPGEHTGTARCGGYTYRAAVTYGATKLLSQFDDGNPESVREKVRNALERFKLGEQMCAETNRRFAKYFLGHRPDNPDVAAVIVSAREKIGRLFRNVTKSRIMRECAFTSGGSVTLPRVQGSSVHKYSVPTETTATNSSLLTEVFPQVRDSAGGHAQIPQLIIGGNKLTFVPKNYKTYRTIASEPSGNMYLQKGLHAVMRNDLLKVRVDLSSQQTNQDLALMGSVTGWLATVDMSMASDTVACNAVEWLFSLVPDVMWDTMVATRSPVGKLVYDDPHSKGRKRTVERQIVYRKFSSMGNALTFEIETSIFWALAVAVCEHIGVSSTFVSVYGDDVIIPNPAVPLFGQVLAECGFRFNDDKTFFDKKDVPTVKAARFRESCGSHYIAGHDVTPVFVKEHPDTLLKYFHLVNNLVRWLRRLENLPDSPDLVKAWAYVTHLRSIVPEQWQKPRIPDGFGDGAFIGTFDECTPKTACSRKRPFVEGYRVEVLTERQDQANGITLGGNAMVFGKKSKGLIAPCYPPRTLENNQRVLEPVSLYGFLLSGLEYLERSGPAWHQITRDLKLSNRDAALQLSHFELKSESSGVPLPHTRRIELGMINIPARASRHVLDGIPW